MKDWFDVDCGRAQTLVCVSVCLCLCACVFRCCNVSLQYRDFQLQRRRLYSLCFQEETLGLKGWKLGSLEGRYVARDVALELAAVRRPGGGGAVGNV